MTMPSTNYVYETFGRSLLNSNSICANTLLGTQMSGWILAQIVCNATLSCFTT